MHVDKASQMRECVFFAILLSLGIGTDDYFLVVFEVVVDYRSSENFCVKKFLPMSRTDEN